MLINTVDPATKLIIQKKVVVYVPGDGTNDTMALFQEIMLMLSQLVVATATKHSVLDETGTVGPITEVGFG
jgi:hypothetical protein